MKNTISSIYINTNDIPKNFVNIGNFNINFNSVSMFIENLPLYFEISNCQRRIKVIQKCQNTITYGVLNWYSRYNRSLLEYFNRPNIWKWVKLNITFTLIENTSYKIKINILIDLEYFNKLNVSTKLPLLIYNIFLDKISKNLEIPLVNEIINKENNSIINNDTSYLRNLYPYQLENLKWMTEIEDSITNRKLIFSSHQNERRGQKSFYLENLNKMISLSTITENLIDHNSFSKFTLLPKGGVLADNVGLGKTTSFISLMASRSSNIPNLVICPRRLCYQWEEEVLKTYPLKVFIISTIIQFKKLTLENINNYDIIILSYSFLTNKNYLNYISNETNKGKFTIEDFEWNRVILDEGHEFINYTSNRYKKEPNIIQDKLNKLKSKFRWICSGTPFASNHDFWRIINFLCPTNSELFKNIWTIRHIDYQLLKKLFRKQIPQNVVKQIIIPKSENETTFLEMSEIERAIYQSVIGDKEKMIQLCNHILVSEHHLNILGNKPISLNEISEKMKQYYYKKQIRLEAQLNRLDSSKGRQMDNILEKMTEVKQKLQTTISKYKLFLNLNSKFKEDICCPICLDDLVNAKKVISECGHFMCMSCATKLFSNNFNLEKKCPMCRETIKGKDLNLVNNNINKNTSENIDRDRDKNENDENDEKYKQWGTKMYNLVKYLHYLLNNNNKNRVIVFSQWNKMLKLVSNVLNLNEINYISLKGSVHVVTSRIKKFKNDDSIRVVLLSSDKAASGLNLTEANHIILLDTLNTSPEKAKSIEEQAIGRCKRLGQDKNIYIKRFIMKDTIEEEYYQKNKDIIIN